MQPVRRLRMGGGRSSRRRVKRKRERRPTMPPSGTAKPHRKHSARRHSQGECVWHLGHFRYRAEAQLAVSMVMRQAQTPRYTRLCHNLHHIRGSTSCAWKKRYHICPHPIKAHKKAYVNQSDDGQIGKCATANRHQPVPGQRGGGQSKPSRTSLAPSPAGATGHEPYV